MEQKCSNSMKKNIQIHTLSSLTAPHLNHICTLSFTVLVQTPQSLIYTPSSPLLFFA